jgi:hypothetical protein
MYECYDCGETFHGYGDCPSCGSVNVGMLDDEYEVDDIEEDEYENDEEINEVLRDIDYDDEDFDEDFED